MVLSKKWRRPTSLLIACLAVASALLLAPLAAAEDIRLKQGGGTYMVPVSINGAITLDFMIDTGASDVSMPGDVVLTLVRTGTLATTDFTGQRTYVLADGSKLPSLQFTLRQLRVGNQVIRNVAASVAPVTSQYPLLGQSFLSRLPPWSIDYRRHVLALNAPVNEAKVRPAQPVAVPSPAPPQVTTAPQVTPTNQNPFGSHGRWASTSSPGAGGEIYLTDIAMIPDGTMVGKVLFTGSPCASWTNFSGRLTGLSAVLSMNMGRCGLTVATLQQAVTGWRGDYRAQYPDAGTVEMGR